MPRCPNGSRKNKKTEKCVSNKSDRSPTSKKVSRSPASATKKAKRVTKVKIYLDEVHINNVIAENMETIKYKDVSIPKMQQVLSKVYYKPRFESEFYFGRSMKIQLKKQKYTTDVIESRLLAEQMYALIREWGKSYIGLEDFTSSDSFYSHSRE